MLRREPSSESIHEGCLRTKVIFRWKARDTLTRENCRVAVVGNVPELGSWDSSNAAGLTTSSSVFPCYYSSRPVSIESGKLVKYKFIVIPVDASGKLVPLNAEFEDGPDREVLVSGSFMVVEDDDGMYRSKVCESMGGNTLDQIELMDRSAHSVGEGYPFSPGSPHSSVGMDIEHKIDSLRQALDCNLKSLHENDTAIIVCFQLPVQVEKLPTGDWKIYQNKTTTLPSLHKLMTGPDGKMRCRALFVGWAGVSPQNYMDQQSLRESLWEWNCIPVFPRCQQDFDEFELFCRTVIRPMCHSVIVSLREDNPQQFNERYWAAYQTMNKLYAEAVTAFALRYDSYGSDDQDVGLDLIWVHDFHLLLCPMYISRRLKSSATSIGLFLHTPFPSSEIFRCIPVRNELLKGVLCADMIQFQFFEYARHFLISCKRFVDVDHSFKLGGLIALGPYCGRSIYVRVGHTCMQYDWVKASMESNTQLNLTARVLRSKYIGSVQGHKVLFASVDRLDRLSGLPQKFLAWRNFMISYPEMLSRTVLVQHAYSSAAVCQGNRDGLAEELEAMVSAINTELGCKTIELIIGFMDQTRRHALLASADVLVDTCLKAGVNLVPFEYYIARAECPVFDSSGETSEEPRAEETGTGTDARGDVHTEASRGRRTYTDTEILGYEEGGVHHQASGSRVSGRLARGNRRGVVIASEFSGCSWVLHGALKANPWHTDQLVKSFKKAADLVCSKESRAEMNERFVTDWFYVSSHSLVKWAEQFLLDLSRTKRKDDRLYVTYGFGANVKTMEFDQSFKHLEVDSLVSAYHNSKHLRLFLLDNEGTLQADRRDALASLQKAQPSVPTADHKSSKHLQSSSMRMMVAANAAEFLNSQGTPPSQSVLNCLDALGSDPRNVVVITSGRSKELLEHWFAPLNDKVGFAAEHGFYMKVPSLMGEDWECLSSDILRTHATEGSLQMPLGSILDMGWKNMVESLMQGYVDRTPGSFVENKGSALVWQYRDAADADFGHWQAKELANALEDLLASFNVEVTSGKGYVEVKVRGVNKGAAAATILQRLALVYGPARPDFVFCIGDDRTDETMFAAVNSVYKKELAQKAELEKQREAIRGKSELQETVSQVEGGMKRAATFQRAGLTSSYTDLFKLGNPEVSPISGRGGSSRNISGLGRSISAYPVLPGSTSVKPEDVPPDPLHAPPHVFTCTVGKKPSAARYYVSDVEEVSEILRALRDAAVDASRLHRASHNPTRNPSARGSSLG